MTEDDTLRSPIPPEVLATFRDSSAPPALESAELDEPEPASVPTTPQTPNALRSSAPPKEMTMTEHIMQFFAYEHLPQELAEVSRPFGELARQIVETLPRNPERTVALRKLLEAKDAAVLAKDVSS